MINIAFSSDNNFVPQLMVSIKSLLTNNKCLDLNLYILDNDISELNKEKLILLVEDYNTNLTFLSVAKNNFKIESYVEDDIKTFSISAYCRLFLSSLLADVDKILYLDCDSLIVDSLLELWNIDITEYMCAGVLDIMPNVYKESIGLKEEDIYINSGVLLINLKLWRERNIEKDFIKSLEKHKNERIHHDQGIINEVLKNQILPISPKYNWLSYFHGKDYHLIIKWFVNPSYYYDDKTMDESSANPVFIHFCNGFMGRPWNNHNHYYFDLYKEYVHLAGINEEEIYVNKKNLPLMSKIFGILSENSFCLELLNMIPDSLARNITNTILKNRLKK